MTRYESLEFAYRPSPDQRSGQPVFHPVVVVGAGPVGLALAIDLAQRGVRVLLLEPRPERPAFINLQQYSVEGFLAERAAALPILEIRWRNNVTGVEPQAGGVTLTIDTPDGPYRLSAGHVAACDGSRSPLRAML